MAPRKVLMAASGDLRQSANETCWPAQAAMEKQVTEALAALGVEVERAHPYDPARKHGFIASQKEGLEIFSKIDPDAPIIVAEAVWQYTQPCPARPHRPSRADPHRRQLVRAMARARRHAEPQRLADEGRRPLFDAVERDLRRRRLPGEAAAMAEAGHVAHDLGHVHPFVPASAPEKARAVGARDRRRLPPQARDHGGFRRRLHGDVQRDHPRRASVPARRVQGAPVAVGPLRRLARGDGRRGAGRLRLARQEGHDVPFRRRSGDRPHARPGPRPVPHVYRGRPHRGDLRLRRDRHPVPAGHEGPDARIRPRRGASSTTTTGRRRKRPRDAPSARARRSSISTRSTNAPGSTPCSPTGSTARSASRSRRPCTTSAGATPTAAATTSDYVWVFEISGAAPPAHHIGGWAGTDSLRQPPMYFRLGGGTVRGVAKPGPIVWSRIFVEGGRLKMDVGRAHVVELPKAETERRWNEHDAAMADHARGAARRVARPVDGPPQGEPHPGRLRHFRCGRRPRARRQGLAGGGTRPRSLALRRKARGTPLIH